MNTKAEIPLRVRRLGEPVARGSERLRELFAAIGEGAFERERDNVPPYAAFDLVREYGFGAFRVARELGGGGATLPQLVEALIELAAVDPNVAHALRSHFIFVDARLGPFARARRHARLHSDSSDKRTGGKPEVESVTRQTRGSSS
jgi:alkylation response protein AidB-like acyl-CoA dehydrogenase